MWCYHFAWQCEAKCRGTLSSTIEPLGLESVLTSSQWGPDMSPCDYDVFPKLKENFWGIGFKNLQQLTRKVTRQIRNINQKHFLTKIQKLPDRWTKVTQKKGGLHWKSTKFCTFRIKTWIYEVLCKNSRTTLVCIWISATILSSPSQFDKCEEYNTYFFFEKMVKKETHII